MQLLQQQQQHQQDSDEALMTEREPIKILQELLEEHRKTRKELEESHEMTKQELSEMRKGPNAFKILWGKSTDNLRNGS